MSYLVFKVSSVLLSLISIVKSDVQLFDEKEIDIYQSTVTPQKSEPVPHEKPFMTMMLIGGGGGGGDNIVSDCVGERNLWRLSLL